MATGSRNINASRTVVLVGTRKGLFVLSADGKRDKWRVEGDAPHFLGQIVNHAVMNPRTGTILAAARAGHLGPSVFRSTNSGKSWKEAASPPAFPKREKPITAGPSATYSG